MTKNKVAPFYLEHGVYWQIMLSPLCSRNTDITVYMAM